MALQATGSNTLPFTTATDVAGLLAACEVIAAQKHDGHLTLLRFTTHWKGCFGTPQVDREEIGALPEYRSLPELLTALLTSA